MNKRALSRQNGYIALLLLTLIVIGSVWTLLGTLNSHQMQLDRNRVTADALAKAKAALIAYATSVDLSGSRRPGDLPCPDLNNDGKKEMSSCSDESKRLGRLPWKDLGLPDMRDATGERLWYAVSKNFRENPRNTPLNSDTNGTIQVVDFSGKVISNVIAIVIAPGTPLQRFSGSLAQDRSSGMENDPTNYLDETATEDNADFKDGGTNGFIGGVVRDGEGRILVNDQILTITHDEIMPLLEKRVAAEVLNCLKGYAAAANNNGRYPWAADLVTSASGTYGDASGTTFGRIPDLMCNTGGNKTPPCGTVTGTNPSMSTTWGGIANCYIDRDWYRDNWREQVFYALADAYKPGSAPPSCGSCPTVAGTLQQVIVFVARKALAGQDRKNKAVIENYLEGENATSSDGVFEMHSTSPTFNDLLAY